MLTAPRVYFAMAKDDAFFSALTKLNAAHVPVFAIALQGLAAMVIALSGRYEQILNYVVSVDVLFFALTAACVFVFRHRRRLSDRGDASAASFRVPGHPVTTALFIAICAGVVVSTVYRYPTHSLIGLGLTITGLPVYLLWRRSVAR